MMEEFVTLKSYDGKLVSVPIKKKEKYIETQQRIQKLIKDGKNTQEILKLLEVDSHE